MKYLITAAILVALLYILTALTQSLAADMLARIGG